MTDIVRDPYGNPLKRDATITTLRAEVERLKALTVKADEAIARQQQDLEEAADRAADCDILRAEVERLRAALELFACDCIDSGNLCPSPQNCRNYIARAALEEKPNDKA